MIAVRAAKWASGILAATDEAVISAMLRACLASSTKEIAEEAASLAKLAEGCGRLVLRSENRRCR